MQASTTREWCKAILLGHSRKIPFFLRVLVFNHIGEDADVGVDLARADSIVTLSESGIDESSNIPGVQIEVTRRKVGRKVLPFLTPVLGEGKPARKPAKVVAQIKTDDGAIYVVDQVLGDEKL